MHTVHNTEIHLFPDLGWQWTLTYGFSSVSSRDRTLLHQALTRACGKNFLLCAFQCRNYGNLVSVGQFLILQSSQNNSIPSCGLDFFKKNFWRIKYAQVCSAEFGGKERRSCIVSPSRGSCLLFSIHAGLDWLIYWMSQNWKLCSWICVL